MNGYNLLEVTIRDILRVISPSKEDWAVRFHIIDEVRNIVGSIESLRGATVEPFGSVASNLFTKWGDLDISIELQNGSYISSPGKKHKQSLLGDVQKALRKKGGFRRLHLIANARVKEWAKTHQINDSKSGTLNSYCLSLLVVFHLQTLVPAILPPLREIYPGNMTDDLTGVRAVAEKHIEDTCAVNINRIKSDKSRLINRSSLSELFISFLFEGVSPYAGQLEDIHINMRWLPKTYTLFVEDPFEQPANTARNVHGNQLIKITEAIQATRGILVSANSNQASLVSVLVGPHISRFVIRTAASSSSAPVIAQSASRAAPPLRRNGFNGRPERKQTTPLQTQHKSQNKGVDNKRQNGAPMNGPMHASTSQKQQQQVWRPRSEKEHG
ncbi:hypothetical protein DH2020_030164 [Rehmannia glutinosa]|uniref:Poly(A) RNA polymerase mitochondrial-like central palm domain-containing protein n=1 Tax=Rehmannia glutinosa TaxID=99300 RepID=A0ABR0VLK4_REHGL